MYKVLYNTADSVIYSQFPERNCGTDQIIELRKQPINSPSLDNSDDVLFGATYNSRILMKFDLTDVSSSVASGKIDAASAKYYLVLKTTTAIALPTSYTIQAFPVSGAWTNGTGYFNNNPSITNGTSWKYRTSKLVGSIWATGSYNPVSTGSFATIGGGGNWFTSSMASQDFNFSDPDVRMDITSIVGQWLSGSIPNEGLILKLPDSLEQDTSEFGTIQFFSRETHTIFVPKLEIQWNSSDISGISQFNEVPSEDFVLYAKNLRESYSELEVPKVRLGVRERYPTPQYSLTSSYLESKRLPTSSYFQIQDVVTDEVIIPFHSVGTKINCDSNGNYFKFDCNSLMQLRYYKFVYKVEMDGGDTVRVVDDSHIFRIIRN